jgi:adenylosuccinate lyase
VAEQLKKGESSNDLVDRLRNDPAFGQVDFEQVLQESKFIGRAPQQVEQFIEEEISPLRKRYNQPEKGGEEVLI